MTHSTSQSSLVITCLLGIIFLLIPLTGCGIINTTTQPTTPPGPLQTYNLTVLVSPPGSGTVSPPGGKYDSGLQVTLTATPASGYTFDYWEGSAVGSSNKVTISMISDKNVTAHFKLTQSPVTTSTTSKPVTPVYPDMIGSWHGTMIITDRPNPMQIGTFSMGVTNQSGATVSGTINITFNSATWTSRGFQGQFRSNGNLSITIAVPNSSTSWSFDGK